MVCRNVSPLVLGGGRRNGSDQAEKERQAFPCKPEQKVRRGSSQTEAECYVSKQLPLFLLTKASKQQKGFSYFLRIPEQPLKQVEEVLGNHWKASDTLGKAVWWSESFHQTCIVARWEDLVGSIWQVGDSRLDQGSEGHAAGNWRSRNLNWLESAFCLLPTPGPEGCI